MPIPVFVYSTAKNDFLRFGRIFCANSAFWKIRNTQSIPNFPKLDFAQNLLPKSSKILILEVPVICF